MEEDSGGSAVESGMSTSNPATLIDRHALRFAADPAALERALADVTFHVPPRNQGQIVEVAYGADSAGLVFRRTLDRSDGSTRYAVADSADCGCDSECSCFEPWNGEPSGFDWVSIEEPPEEGDGEEAAAAAEPAAPPETEMSEAEAKAKRLTRLLEMSPAEFLAYDTGEI